MRRVVVRLAALCSAVLLLQGAVQMPVLAQRAAFSKVVLPQDARMHQDAAIEWWYYTGHLRDKTGRTFGFELAVFKQGGLQRIAPLLPSDVGYRIDVAITDEVPKKFYSAVRYLAPSRQTVMSGTTLKIRMPGGSASIAVDTLPGPALRYRLHGAMAAGSIDVTVDTARRPLLEGDAGVLAMGDQGGYSYYYSLTNLRTIGTVTLGGQRFAVTGTTWMDHQWGNWTWDQILGWSWMGVQLSNGTSVALFNFDSVQDVRKAAGASFPDGAQVFSWDSQITPAGGHWTSPRTGVRYPQGWHIAVPRLGLEAQVQPTVAGQEIVNPLFLGPTYWEGSCRVTGTLHGTPITGMAYTELVGYGGRQAMGSLWGFF